MTAAVVTQAPVFTGLLDGAALASLRSSLDGDRVGAADVAAALRTIDSSINQLQAERLMTVAAGSRLRVFADDGLVDTGAWVARESRLGGAEGARSVRLAQSMEALPTAGAALSDGSISVKHVEVIANATKNLPADLSPAERHRVETELTEQAKIVDPTTLRKVSRRAVEIAGRSITEADAHENQIVRTGEEIALLKTRLSMHDNDDGLTVSGHFTVPAFAGEVLRKAVQQITAPRRAAARNALDDGRSWTRTEDHAADWPHHYGLALVELLEHLPTDRLHTKVAATVVVTMDADQLRAEVDAAGVSSVALKVAGTDVGVDISAGKARQLACNAGLVPAVLNGASVSLDLGRSSRLFSEAQRTVLATKYKTCATAGCDRPYSWSELHHQRPWQHGGQTDLDQAVPLCGFHHRMIHDSEYLNTVTRKPDGLKRVTFRQRI